MSISGIRPAVGTPVTHNGRPAEVGATYSAKNKFYAVGRYVDELGGDGFVVPASELVSRETLRGRHANARNDTRNIAA